ncbi:MAG: YidC/Oxa1 family membrane protein insertase [Clostridiales bacterium]|jgi:YidC/Oxa1 family membrane protein insertase|nr:YidC/Oxa1 family membrane protein insertase [Clostridiales bacterium]
MVNIIFAAEMTNIFGKVMLWIYEGVGNYALAVILFTLLFKAAMTPLDFWQKNLMRKNNKALKVMKPKLDQLKKETGGNQQLYMQKQQALYKEHGYSMLGACLPTLVTLVVFIIIFQGFTAMVKYQNLSAFEQLDKKYYEIYNDESPLEIKAYIDGKGWDENNLSAEQLKEAKIAADAVVIPKAEAAVISEYDKQKDGFFWVKNIFMPDTPWSKVVPDYGLFSGKSGGFLGIGKLNIEGIEEADYDRVMGPIIKKYESGNAMDNINGFLVLPILCLLLNVLMMKLNPQSAQQPTPPPSFGADPDMAAKQAQSTSKVMMYMMPAMMFIFAMFYSSAFTVYLVVSSSFSMAFNLIYNAVMKKKDKAEEETTANTTYVRKSELENIKKQKEKEEKEKLQKEQEDKAKKILEKTESKFKDINKL